MSGSAAGRSPAIGDSTGRTSACQVAWSARVGERPAVIAGRALGDDLRRNLAASGKAAEEARKVLFGQRAR